MKSPKESPISVSRKMGVCNNGNIMGVRERERESERERKMTMGFWRVTRQESTRSCTTRNEMQIARGHFSLAGGSEFLITPPYLRHCRFYTLITIVLHTSESFSLPFLSLSLVAVRVADSARREIPPQNGTVPRKQCRSVFCQSAWTGPTKIIKKIENHFFPYQFCIHLIWLLPIRSEKCILVLLFKHKT